MNCAVLTPSRRACCSMAAYSVSLKRTVVTFIGMPPIVTGFGWPPWVTPDSETAIHVGGIDGRARRRFCAGGALDRRAGRPADAPDQTACPAGDGAREGRAQREGEEGRSGRRHVRRRRAVRPLRVRRAHRRADRGPGYGDAVLAR